MTEFTRKLRAIRRAGPARALRRAALGLLAVILSALALALPSGADIRRSCQGVLSINVAGAGNDLSYDLRAYVTAQNRMWANTARERSRDAMIYCTRNHWDMRMSANRPAACDGIDGYPFRAFSQDMTAAICAANPGRQSFMVDVVLDISGDTGCHEARNINDWGSYRIVIADDHRVYSWIPREQLFMDTDMPGFDIRNFHPDTDNHEECRKACDRMDGCWAWTYVRPRDGHPSQCWLKDTVPERRSSGCCISGTKGED